MLILAKVAIVVGAAGLGYLVAVGLGLSALWAVGLL